MKTVCLCLLSAAVTVSALSFTGCRVLSGQSLFSPPAGYNCEDVQPSGTIVAPVKPGQPLIINGKTAVQEVVTKQVWFFWIAGVGCLLAAGALAYLGQYVAAVKVGLAGLILPIFATWWSQHYALVIAATLIGAAVWYMLTHAAARSAITAELDNLKSSLEKKT